MKQFDLSLLCFPRLPSGTFLSIHVITSAFLMVYVVCGRILRGQIVLSILFDHSRTSVLKYSEVGWSSWLLEDQHVRFGARTFALLSGP